MPGRQRMASVPRLDAGLPLVMLTASHASRRVNDPRSRSAIWRIDTCCTSLTHSPASLLAIGHLILCLDLNLLGWISLISLKFFTRDLNLLGWISRISLKFLTCNLNLLGWIYRISLKILTCNLNLLRWISRISLKFFTYDQNLLAWISRISVIFLISHLYLLGI